MRFSVHFALIIFFKFCMYSIEMQEFYFTFFLPFWLLFKIFHFFHCCLGGVYCCYSYFGDGVCHLPGLAWSPDPPILSLPSS
jgi:hypothetical protein